MRSYLRKIDTKTEGDRYDVTPLFSDPDAFSNLVADLSSPFQSQTDLVAGVDALGFILGTAIACKLNVGFLPIRKGDKLPVPVRKEVFVDYTGREKSLELRTDTELQERSVLIVDEWVETGAQITAAITLVEGGGGNVIGLATIHADKNPVTDELRKQYDFRIASELSASDA